MLLTLGGHADICSRFEAHCLIEEGSEFRSHRADSGIAHCGCSGFQAAVLLGCGPAGGHARAEQIPDRGRAHWTRVHAASLQALQRRCCQGLLAGVRLVAMSYSVIFG